MKVFASWGRFVCRRRGWVLSGSMVMVLIASAVLSMGGHLRENQRVPTEAGQAGDLIDTELNQGPPSTEFGLVFRSTRLSAASAQFRAAMLQALAPLQHDAHVTRIVTPYTSPANPDLRLISRDQHSAVADVVIGDSYDNAKTYYPSLRALVHSDVLTVEATGGLPVDHDYNQLLNEGLARSNSVALPLTLVLLLLVFGTVIAAALPLAIGIFTIMGATAVALLLSRFTDISPTTTEFVTFLGLGLAIDYSLFIVNRFREELGAGRTVADALAVTMATTGRAIVFSGLTVMAGLSGLFFYNGTWLAEIAAPLVGLVALTVFFGMTLLPASLALLGRRVDRWRVPIPRLRRPGGFWHRLATWVMRRPWLVLAPTVSLVVLAASPLADLHLATDHGSSLPISAESRRGSDALLSSFPQLTQATIPVVVRYDDQQPLSAQHVGELYDLSRRIRAIPDVVAIDSVVGAAPRLDRASFVRLLSAPRSSWPQALSDAARRSIGSDVAVLVVSTNQQGQSEGARQVVRSIRAIGGSVHGQMLVTGDAAYDMDETAWLIGRTPLALGFVIGATFLILLLLLGSVAMPIKAVLTNLLSMSVAFGAMVWIFQQGHLAGLLGFSPAPIDPTVPVAMFCVVFGLSMDYEVFLLTRVQEEYLRSGDNAHAVALGLERCGRLVTFAAAIMVTVFASFALGDVTVIKMVGLGTAIAIAVDATVMRGLIVPAVMVIMGRANWWAPRWLRIGTARSGPARPLNSDSQSGYAGNRLAPSSVQAIHHE